MVRPEAKWSAWDIVTGEFSCKLGSFRTFFVHLTTRTTLTQIDLNFEVACAFIFQSLFQTKNECRTFSWSQLCRNCPLEHVFIRLFSLFMSEVQSSSYEGIHAFLGWPTSLGRIEWWCLVSKWWQTHPWDLFLHLMRGVGEGIRVAKGGVCLSGFATVKS